MGDDRAYPWSSQYNSGYPAWGLFKKVTQIPQNVIIATEVTDVIIANDERFQLLEDLTWKKRQVGWPHRKKANFLFNDGTCRLINPWDTARVANPYVGSLPLPQNYDNPLLDDFMIDARRWDKTRPIPQF
jgi:prepilin-type processing-associated H-X9-DG protein